MKERQELDPLFAAIDFGLTGLILRHRVSSRLLRVECMRVVEEATPLATQHSRKKWKTNFGSSTLITCRSRRVVASPALDIKSPYKHCLVGCSVVCPAGATRKARAHAMKVFEEFLFVNAKETRNSSRFLLLSALVIREFRWKQNNSLASLT